jgi:hypothetical protein
LFWTDPTSFYLIGRILTILLSTAAIPLTYVLCRRMAGEGAALAAATFVAVSPLHVDFSRIVRVDAVMTTFILVAMLYALKAMDGQLGKDFVLSGVCTGLATATKWPGISAAVIAIMATGLAAPERPVSWTTRARWSGFACLGVVTGFLVATPFLLVELPQALRQVAWEVLRPGGHLSATGSPGLPNYLWYLTGPLQQALGGPLELFALIGLAASCQARVRSSLLLASFSLLFLLGVGLLNLRWDRWIVPLVPSVAILAAIGLEVASRALPWGKKRSAVRHLVIVGLAVVLVFPSATEAFRRGTTLDTRDIAKEWIERHVPRGSKVAVEQYAPPISRDDYRVFVFLKGSLQRDGTTRNFKGVLGDLRTLDPLRGNAVDYVLLSSYFDRFRDEKQRYPDEVRFYEELLARSDLLYELKPTEATRGPVIRVLKLRQ